MKKIIILISLLLILTWCSIDWNNEKENYLFKKQQECYSYKDKIQNDLDKERQKLWWETWKWLWEIFYSKKNNSCFYVNKDMWSIVNLFENKTIFYWWTDKEKINNKVKELKWK